MDAASATQWLAHHHLLARQVVAGLRPPRRGPWSAKGAKTPGPAALVLYSQVAWDDVWQRPQELAMRLAQRRPVLFLAPVQVHQTAGPLAERWRPLRLLQGGRLLVASPQILTGEYRAAPVRALNRVIAARVAQRLVGRRRTIFVTNSPFADGLMDDLEPLAVGYDIIDDFCAFEWSPPDGRRREGRILERADFATAGTWSLYETFAPRARRMEFLASGVDVEKLRRPAPEPEDLKSLRRPRLLYVGTLNDRISGELIAETARAMPETSVVLVGPRRVTFGSPRFPENVVELGLKPHDALAGYYQHCDAGLMPFAENDAARAVNPVKTLEYLACGLPVISTPVPADVKRFYVPPVVLAPPREWPRALRRILAEDSAEARTERARFADGRSWDRLAERYDELLTESEQRNAGVPL